MMLIVAFQNLENAPINGNCAACTQKAESIFDAETCETCSFDTRCTCVLCI